MQRTTPPPIFPHEPYKMEKDYKEKKSKQPSSPGGRLATFLISLFHQSSSKKKTTKSSTTTQSMKDGELEEIKHGQERRRKSISYPQKISGDSYCSKSTHSSKSSSGFRTPPPLPYMPKEKVTTSSVQREALRGGRVHGSGFAGSGDHDHELFWRDGYGEKRLVLGKNGGDHHEDYIGNSGREEGFTVKNKGFGRSNEEEEEVGDEGSDSSSDLFELKNYDLADFSSSNLPVYGATNVGIIEIKGSTIPSVAF